MNIKYNLALTPQEKGEEVIRLAQKFSKIADKYLLGENSLPHVTLYQFEAEEKEIDALWGRVCEKWEEEPIDLEFIKFSCLTLDNIIYWFSLLPNNGDSLHKMHGVIASLIDLPIKSSFDPHMTLIDSKDKNYEKVVDGFSGSYRFIADKFILTLGKSDDVGQFTEVVHRYEAVKISRM